MNTIDKYTSEWFHETAQADKYVQLDKSLLKARDNFLHEYGIEQIKALEGYDLLHKLFFNETGNKDNLCYMLEMDKNLIGMGGIKGGSSYKYGLFYHKSVGSWETGSPMKPVKLTEREAIELAQSIRDNLVEAAEIIGKSAEPVSREDYETLYKKLEHIQRIDSVWVLKYLQILYPHILPVFYGKDIHIQVLRLLKEEPSDIPFVRMGQINLFIRKCNIPSWIFGPICYPLLEENTDILSEATDDVQRYWIYSPGANACFWDEFYSKGIMALGWGEIGDLTSFSSKEQMRLKMKEVYADDTSFKNSALATWQFLHEMKNGDIVFVKKGRSQIIGSGVISGDYEFVNGMKDGFCHCRKVKWQNKGVWDIDEKITMKTLTDVTPYTEFIEKINALFPEASTEDDEPEVEYDDYTADDFLEDVYMEPEDYKTLVSVLRKKKNIILQGAPGVGKTYAAKRLAFSMIGKKDKSRVMMVQFHQSYSYEDFIMGYRPISNGFELKKGAFYNFCKMADDDREHDYFFIIDEINRGNLSKIFGELFMLIETDKRGIELQLLYSDEKFCVPANVYIIGMMNTADRSLAMLDYALRRRFAFIDMKPGFDTQGFQEYQEKLESKQFDALISCVQSLNKVIAHDDSLGEGFCIGHSYFCNLNAEELDGQELKNIVDFELIPLLKEYWFDEIPLVKEWSNKLWSAIK